MKKKVGKGWKNESRCAGGGKRDDHEGSGRWQTFDPTPNYQADVSVSSMDASHVWKAHIQAES